MDEEVIWADNLLPGGHETIWDGYLTVWDYTVEGVTSRWDATLGIIWNDIELGD